MPPHHEVPPDPIYSCSHNSKLHKFTNLHHNQSTLGYTVSNSEQQQLSQICEIDPDSIELASGERGTPESVGAAVATGDFCVDGGGGRGAISLLGPKSLTRAASERMSYLSLKTTTTGESSRRSSLLSVVNATAKFFAGKKGQQFQPVNANLDIFSVNVRSSQSMILSLGRQIKGNSAHLYRFIPNGLH